MAFRTNPKKIAKPKRLRQTPLPVKDKSKLKAIGEAVDRHPVRAVEVLRRWINERH